MIEINVEKVSKMSQEELFKLVLDLDLEIHSLNTKLKINSSIQDSFENTFYNRMGKIANAQNKENKIRDNERYDKIELPACYQLGNEFICNETFYHDIIKKGLII